jgi:hypothetical protein
VKLAIHLYLVPSLKTSGAIPPLSHKATRRTEGQLCLLPHINMKLYPNLFYRSFNTAKLLFFSDGNFMNTTIQEHVSLFEGVDITFH